jgi:diguanylate cyclase (GGDEF)-like protein
MDLGPALEAAELELYVSPTSAEVRGAQLRDVARASGAVAEERRATLILSDALSRSGQLEAALRCQLEVLTDAELAGDENTAARAHCMLTSTYNRLAEVGQSQASAEAAVRLLDENAPPTWRAEHTMVLALFTSYLRRGPTDFTTFDEALRLARESGRLLLELATLNNYAYVALTARDPRAAPICAELRDLAARHLPEHCPSTWLDTIAIGQLREGDLDGASRTIGRAILLGNEGQAEPSALAKALLTDAEIHLARNDPSRAEARASEARQVAIANGAGEAAALALRMLANLAGAAGDFEAGFELLSDYIGEWDAYQSERSEMHAATLQAIYGVELERQRRFAVERLADTDALTGLANRRHLNRRMSELAGTPIAVALLDVDHFKRVNDRYSHAVGDEVLRMLAAALATVIDAANDPLGFAARIGGEEFVLLLGPDRQAATDCCERIRNELETTDWTALAETLSVTVSIGLTIDASGDVARSELLGRADAQLYRAKQNGRNRIELG